MNQTLRGFIRKELTQTLRDPRMRFFLFVTPMIQMTLFGLALSNEVKNIRLAAVFDSRDEIVREIYERSVESRWFIPARTSESDPFKMIQAGEADAVILPPPGGFTRALGQRQAPLQILIDATNVNQARSVENYLTSIIHRTIQERFHHPEAKPRIQFDWRVLYNPSLDTSIFMVPGVMCMLMVFMTMMLCMAAITREKEMGTFEMLISAPVRPREVIYGKTVPYVILGMGNFPLTLGVAVFIFGVPVRGSLWILTISAFFFVCTCVALGTLISTLCRNQQQANLASFLFMFPAIMFSGLMFPVENMPDSIRCIAYIDPLFHYLALLRNIMLKGGDLKFVAVHVLALGFTAGVAIFFSFKRFRTTLT